MSLLNTRLNVSVWEALVARVLLLLPEVVTGAVLFAAFWIAAVVVNRLLIRIAVPRMDHDLALLLARVAKISLIVVGGMTALGTMGIDVSSLVAGLGLTGFALGFALKDIISNALAGILVIIYEPFKRGDAITVTGFQGSVQEINFRYTVLEMEGKRAFIPNSNLFTNPVVVHKRGWTPPPVEAKPAEPPRPAKEIITDESDQWPTGH